MVEKENGVKNPIFHKELLNVFAAIDRKYGLF